MTRIAQIVFIRVIPKSALIRDSDNTAYRNPNLAEAMKNLGYVQRFGVGIPTARKLLLEAGHPEPEFDVHDNYVLATIKAVQES